MVRGKGIIGRANSLTFKSTGKPRLFMGPGDHSFNFVVLEKNSEQFENNMRKGLVKSKKPPKNSKEAL